MVDLFFRVISSFTSGTAFGDIANRSTESTGGLILSPGPYVSDMPLDSLWCVKTVTLHFAFNLREWTNFQQHESLGN